MSGLVRGILLTSNFVGLRRVLAPALAVIVDSSSTDRRK